jgi:hypothetical protein
MRRFLFSTLLLAVLAGGALSFAGRIEFTAAYLTQLRQNKDGESIPIQTRPLGFSHLKSGWVHCAGSVAPPGCWVPACSV